MKHEPSDRPSTVFQIVLFEVNAIMAGVKVHGEWTEQGIGVGYVDCRVVRWVVTRDGGEEPKKVVLIHCYSIALRLF